MATLSPGLTAVPQPAVPRRQMDALSRFYGDVTWTGTIEAGATGPGTPAMTVAGRGVQHHIQDGLWVVADYEQDQFLSDGTFVLTWKVHWVTGWDAQAGEYRAVLTDNNAQAAIMRGRIDGDVLTYETFGDGPMRLRLRWDGTAAPDVKFTSEMSRGGGPWSLAETYTMTPA